MEEKRLLEFNYPLLPQEDIAFEIKIKQMLRNFSYNVKEEREVERYSDKYISSILYEDIMATVNIELMGPELVRMYGADFNKHVDVIQADANDNSSETNEDNAEDASLGGGDDYSEYYNDEEDLIGENNGDDNNYM